MRIGEKDTLGRVLKLIRGKLVLTRSKQNHCVAVCDGNEQEQCSWVLSGQNAMGVASLHASAKGHKVVVTREVVTEYDGATPREHPDMKGEELNPST